MKTKLLILQRWLVIVAAVFSSARASAAARPNIVFLLADDLAANSVGYSGNKDVITPNIDRLARDGVRFMNHYDTTSICMASRCTIMTGLYEYRHGCNFDHGDLERRFMDQSYPVRLRQAGYFTGFAGKIGFVLQGEKFEALEPLFDQWAGGPGQTLYETAKNKGIAKYAGQYPHCSRAYGAWALDFLKLAKQDGRPFCLSISFKAPHMPYTPDPVDLKLYEGKGFARPANYGVEKGAHLSPQVHTSRAATSYREWVTDFDDTAAKYYALVTGVDAAVGMIRDGLAREGLEKSTVLIFTSDNGYNAGSHGFGDKVIPYEEGSKAPLIIYDPRLPSGRNGKACEAVTGNTDMAATILAIAGSPEPAGIDGKSLLPLLANPQGHVREALPLFNFWGIDSAQSMAIVTPDWKYIHWYYGGGMKPAEELFHLAEDRIEMKNIARDASLSEQLERMRALYDAQHADIARQLAPNHGYEKYPTLFSRNIAWEQKAPLLEPATKEPAAKAEKKKQKAAKKGNGAEATKAKPTEP
jgi:arylsulfatase A-like enzyme